MSDELATIAMFWSPVEANLAKGRLEAAGITAFLQGEEAVAMNWLLSNALGGIKLQVAAQDLERAQACLAEVRSTASETPDEAAVQAETEPGSTGREPGPAAPADEEAEPAPTVREQNADRAWRGAVFGLVFLPLQLYVFYLLVKVYVSEDVLRDEHRRRAWLACGINLPLMVGFCVLVRALLSVSFGR
jgi:hypothetical protein